MILFLFEYFFKDYFFKTLRFNSKFVYFSENVAYFKLNFIDLINTLKNEPLNGVQTYSFYTNCSDKKIHEICIEIIIYFILLNFFILFLIKSKKKF